MKRIILSGFGAFGNYKSNLSQTVAEKLDGKVIGDYKIKSLIFSAKISKNDRGEILFEMARMFRAVSIISLGVASEKKGFCIETKVRNLFGNEKYCPGELLNKPINPARETGEELKLDLRPWNINNFRDCCREAGLATDISKDCGGFCCNQLTYQARLSQLTMLPERNISFIFLHIPCAEEDVPDAKEFSGQGKITMDAKTVTNGLSILIEGAKL
jgi:pyrrolidone-carboxylate peptidase